MQASELSPHMTECCTEVLDAMYFTSVFETRQQLGVAESIANSGYAFSLSFRGDVRGTFSVHLDEAGARTLAANFLGEDEDALSADEIAEVVGELANMFCGSVVSRIGGATNFVLSHPEPLNLEDSSAVLNQEESLSIVLDTDIGEVRAWVTLDAPTFSRSAPAPSASQEMH